MLQNLAKNVPVKYKYDGENMKKMWVFFVIHYKLVMIIEFIRSFHKFCNCESTNFFNENECWYLLSGIRINKKKTLFVEKFVVES